MEERLASFDFFVVNYSIFMLYNLLFFFKNIYFDIQSVCILNSFKIRIITRNKKIIN